MWSLHPERVGVQSVHTDVEGVSVKVGKGMGESCSKCDSHAKKLISGCLIFNFVLAIILRNLMKQMKDAFTANILFIRVFITAPL